MSLQKQFTPAIVASLITLILILATGSYIAFLWLPQNGNTQITLPMVFQYVWSEGLMGHYSVCRLNITCRLTHLVAVATYHPIAIRLLLITGCCFIGGIFTFILTFKYTPLRESARTIRGNKIYYDADARKSLRARLLRTGKTDANTLWLVPYVQLTIAAMAYNIGLLGDHGSGKTGILRGWIQQLLGRCRTIIHDAKGDITAGLPTDDFLLISPSDRRGWVWAIGRDIRTTQDAIELAAKFVPTETTGETIWTDSARVILSALIETLQKEHGPRWSWEELYIAVFQPAIQIRASLEEIASPAAMIIEIESNGILSRTSQSILLTMWIAALNTIKPMVDVAKAVPSKHRFSISDWLSPKSSLPKTIALQHSAEYPMLSSAISGLFIEIVAGKILAPSTPNRNEPWLYLILDELPVLQKLKRLPTLLNVGREKGVRAICATQDWEQIEKIYGREDAATLEARFKIKVVCSLGISETRDRVVERFGGKRTIEEWDDAGKGKSRIRRESEINVIEPHQLSDDLGVHWTAKALTVRAAIFGLGAVAVVNIPFTAWLARRPSHSPISTAKNEVTSRKISVMPLPNGSP
ncbi:hypothetical protein AAKU58_000236 [Oxalobacteraceae bacterium GrIS 1.18]